MSNRSSFPLLGAVAGAGGLVTLGCMVKHQRRRREFDGKTVLITGGSRGLGLEMARLWAERGARVAICARTAEDVERAVAELRAKGHQVMGMTCDVRSQTAARKFIRAVAERWKTIDVLVNNAGIIQAGPIECMTVADYEAAMATHFWGPLYLIQAALPYMQRQGGGRIVNITSIGAQISIPHLVPYSASKFALFGLSEGLRAELAQHGIKVTTVVPGLMRTGSPRNALFKGRYRAEYAWFSISDSLPLLSIASTRAARQVVRACRHGRPYLAISLPCKVATRLHGLFPGITAVISGWVNRLLPGPGGIGRKSRLGKQSFSRWSPSLLTQLSERAARRNNEMG